MDGQVMGFEPASALDDEELELVLLLEAIYLKFHYDFRGYSRGSLGRRLKEALVHFSCRTISQLQDRMLHEPDVFPALLGYLTVGVSDLFRDAAFFRALREEIVPVLRTYPSLRVWIAGCATGEEAYSHAILLAEEGLLERAVLYATDINAGSLQAAQAGVYGLDRLEAFAQNHRLSGARTPLSDHYTAAYGSLVFDRSLRDKIVFSDHSLATDGVFAEMQVVSCRNVLIYFEHALQNRALGLFRDTLCHRGFLGLGAPETLRFTDHEASFVEVAERWYQRC
jgi:chemotaxis protein methyltransferase CheR